MALLLRVFTHPACSGCGAAVKMAWEATKDAEDIEMRTVALETKAGLAEAQKEHILTIPSIIISEGKQELHRFVGTPAPEELLHAIEMSNAKEM